MAPEEEYSKSLSDIIEGEESKHSPQLKSGKKLEKEPSITTQRLDYLTVSDFASFTYYNVDDFWFNRQLVESMWDRAYCYHHLINTLKGETNKYHSLSDIVNRHLTIDPSLEAYSTTTSILSRTTPETSLLVEPCRRTGWMHNAQFFSKYFELQTDKWLKYHAYKCRGWAVPLYEHIPLYCDQVLVSYFPVIDRGTRKCVYDLGTCVLKRIDKSLTSFSSSIEMTDAKVKTFPAPLDIWAKTYEQPHLFPALKKPSTIQFSIQEYLVPIPPSNLEVLAPKIRQAYWSRETYEEWKKFWQHAQTWEWGLTSKKQLKIYSLEPW